MKTLRGTQKLTRDWVFVGALVFGMAGIDADFDHRMKNVRKTSAALHAAQEEHTKAHIDQISALKTLTGLRIAFDKSTRKNLARVFDTHWDEYVKKEENREEVIKTARLLSLIRGSKTPTNAQLEELISTEVRKHVLERLFISRMGLNVNPTLTPDRQQYSDKLGGISLGFAAHAKIEKELEPTPEERDAETALEKSKKPLAKAKKTLDAATMEYNRATELEKPLDVAKRLFSYPAAGALFGGAVGAGYGALRRTRKNDPANK